MALQRAGVRRERATLPPALLLAVPLLVAMLLLLGWQQRRDGGARDRYLVPRPEAPVRQDSWWPGGSPQAPDQTLNLVRRLLPLANLSTVTTAALLDATDGLVGDTRALVRLHQELYCSARLHEPGPPGSVRTQFSNVSLFVYGQNDVVSSALSGGPRAWERIETAEMLLAMRAPVPAYPADLSSPSLWKRQAKPFVVDVGANVGWFALNAAAAGGTVAAFEAMPSNVALIRASLCSNPWLMERIALYGTGLGTKRSNCFIISDINNKGDGHTICDREPAEVIVEWKQQTSWTYEVRGAMATVRLDSLVDQDVQVAKLDVEGFELPVLQGATQLLRSRNVWFMITECNQNFIKAEGQAAFLKFLDEEGYYVSSVGFKGPFIPTEKLKQGHTTPLRGVTDSLYLVKKPLHDAVMKAAAAKPGGGGGVFPESAVMAGRRRRRRRALLGGGGGGGAAAGGGGWAAWLDAGGGGAAFAAAAAAGAAAAAA